MGTQHKLRSILDRGRRSLAVVLRDVGSGALEIGHNSLALVGLAVVVVVAFFAGRPDLREQTEAWAFGWLQQRVEARNETVDDPVVARAERVDDAGAAAAVPAPAELTRQQAAVAQWIARRYGVAPEPVGRLVQEAWVIGQKVGLDPTLILAIVAIESRFNPFAQSAMGAQGLMQVMTRVHGDKYEAFGGTHAAFDPVSNLRVGVQVLRECIARAGGLEAGLRWYVGAGNQADDGGYIGKVLAEQIHLQRVASGKSVPTNASSALPKPAAPKPEAASDDGSAPRGDERVALLR